MNKYGLLEMYTLLNLFGVLSEKNPGGAGSAGRQRAGESACAAYVRHSRLYLSIY